MKPRWTKQEVDFLRDNIHSLTLEQISAHLNRGIPAIKVKCWDCGISRSKIKLETKVIEFHLADEPEYSFVEIGEILGISEDNARNYYRSAMKKMEKIL